MDLPKTIRKPFLPAALKRTLEVLPIAALLAASILFFLAVPNAHPAQVTLAWNASADPKVTGYKVYYGLSSRNYILPGTDVGNVTTFTLTGLPDGVSLYFALTAYYESGLESGYSDEVVYNPPPACTYSISPGTQSFGAPGGSGAVSVSAQAGCAWTAVSNAAWVVVTSNAAGSGNGTLYYSVSTNPGSGSRSGTMTIAGRTFTVSQSGAPCSYSLAPASQSFTAAGGAGGLTVTAPSGCSWNSSSNAGWLAITSGASGSGNGSVAYSVSANASSLTRNGTLTVAGQTFAVAQQGVSCTYSISPASQSFAAAGGTGGVTVTAPAGCSWNSSSNAGWLSINSGGSGSGNGSVAYSVASNASSLTRNATLTVAGQSFSVAQQGVSCTYSLSPSSRSVGASGGIGSIQMTAPEGCSWSASSGGAWITITTGSAGSGNGTIGYSAAPNAGNTPRTGVITAAGQTFTLSQAGVLQFSLNISKTGTGSGTVSTNPAGTIFSQGTMVTLSAVPDGSSVFAGWSGGCSGLAPSCTVTMNSDLSVTAAYRLKTFTITPVAGANGSISPGAAVTVDYGASQAFSITPAAGYQVSDISVDGVSVGAATSYLFGNVRADHALSASFAAVPAPPPAPFILAFRVGEVEYVGSEGIRYLPDRYFTGGNIRASNATIKNTRDISLYQRERYGSFVYRIPLANGDYEVTLKFAELFWNSRGKRVFNVYVKGKRVVNKLDLYAVAGNSTAYDVSLLVKVEDGVLNLDFVPLVDQATVSAIVVRALADSEKAPSSPARLKRYFSTQPR